MELSMVFAVLGLLFKATTVYFAAVALRWMFAKRKSWPQAAPRTRFAVVIAARNEEAVIGRLVKSLMEQDYPRELFDVYVAPNNCTDDTAGAAFQAGERRSCSATIPCGRRAMPCARPFASWTGRATTRLWCSTRTM